jgi:hypothetical protein
LPWAPASTLPHSWTFSFAALGALAGMLVERRFRQVAWRRKGEAAA